MAGSRYWNQAVILHSSLHYGKETCFWSVLNPGHLYLILMIIVRVIGKGFCLSPDGFRPEYGTLCSEALDKDALIWCIGLINLLIRLRLNAG